MFQRVYLDNSATTPVDPRVVEAMTPFLTEKFGNASSIHFFGQEARAAIDKARHQTASLINARPNEIVFTSGGTESNNLAIRGVAEARSERQHVVTTVIEHPATEQPCAWLERHGTRLTRIGVDVDGRARVEEARTAIDAATALVTVMHSNNETGVLQPIADFAELAHAVGAVLHTDAAQSAGKVALNVRKPGVDLLSVAGHKLYAPKGVGALYVRRGTPMVPFVLGAGHERGLRPGTENVAAIVGLGMACEIAGRDLEAVAARVTWLRDDLWQRLESAVPGVKLNGHRTLRLPNTLNVRFPRASGNAILAGAPAIAASTGSACHAGGESASAVILAMGIAAEDAVGSIRLTLGRGTTSADIVTAAESLIRSWHSALRT